MLTCQFKNFKYLHCREKNICQEKHLQVRSYANLAEGPSFARMNKIDMLSLCRPRLPMSVYKKRQYIRSSPLAGYEFHLRSIRLIRTSLFRLYWMKQNEQDMNVKEKFVDWKVSFCSWEQGIVSSLVLVQYILRQEQRIGSSQVLAQYMPWVLEQGKVVIQFQLLYLPTSQPGTGHKVDTGPRTVLG